MIFYANITSDNSVYHSIPTDGNTVYVGLPILTIWNLNMDAM